METGSPEKGHAADSWNHKTPSIKVNKTCEGNHGTMYLLNDFKCAYIPHQLLMFAYINITDVLSTEMSEKQGNFQVNNIN